MSKKELKEEKHFLFNYVSIIILVIFLIISLAFFFLLSQSIPEKSFGLTQIAFSLTFSILATIFLMWTKSLSKINDYLGTIIGLAVLGALEYALFVKYNGPYTLTFGIITGITVIIFLGINFIAALRNKISDSDDYYDENPTK